MWDIEEVGAVFTGNLAATFFHSSRYRSMVHPTASTTAMATLTPKQVAC